MTELSRKPWMRILTVALLIGLLETGAMLLLKMAARAGLNLPFWLEVALDAGLVVAGAVLLFWFAGMKHLSRHWAEEKGRASAEQRLHADLKRALDEDEHALVSICDVAGTIIFANEKFCKVSGFSEKELLGHNHRIVNSGHHDEAYFQNLWAVITQGRPWQGELCNRRKDGSLYWMDTTITPFFDEHGKPCQYVSVRRDITELKEAQSRAQRLGERLQWLLDASPVVVYAHENPADLAECTFISGNALDAVGYTPARMLAASGFWLRHLHPDDRAGAKSHLQRLLEAGQATLEYRFLSARGEYRWICDHAKVVRDDAGAAQAIVGSWTDVTEGKAAELERRRLRMAVEASTDMVLLTDAQGVIEYANPAFYQFTGWQSAEVLGQTPKILQSGKTPLAVYQGMIETLLRGEPWHGRLCNRRKAGAASRPAASTWRESLPRRRKDDPAPGLLSDPLLYWADVNITPILDEAGAKLGFVSFQRDISETVAREERLALARLDADARLAVVEILNQPGALEERFARVLERLFALPDLAGGQRQGGIFLRDRDSGGLAAFVPQGGFGGGLVHRDGEIPASACLRGQADGAGGAGGAYYSVPLAHGGELLGVLLLCAGPEVGQTGERLGMLNQVGEYLGLALVRDQTRRMIEQARDAALDASRQKSEFLANMSHEIRTPMNGVLGMLELLRRSRLTGEQQEFAETAAQSAEALLDIINGILDYSKIEAGKLELDNVDFNVRELVEEVCALLAASAYAKGLELTCFVEPKVPALVCGDPTRLRQVLTNLLGNAIKFTDHGEVSVETVCLSQQDARAVLRFTVKDTGIGILPEDRERLFRPFEQADGTTTRRFGGTGLGLTISRSLILRMGGDIHVDSEAGVGSTFGFTVDLEQRPVSAPSDLPRSLSRRRVLVVDDNATNRAILQRFLFGWGAEVIVSGHARDALEALRAALAAGKPFELVILDLHMPEMDGLMLARAMAQEEGLAGTPRILLSSGGMVSEQERAEVGIRQALTKPVRQSQLFDAVVSSLDEGWIKSAGDRPKADSVLPSFAGKKVLMVEDNLINQKVALKMLECFGLQARLAGDGRQALAELGRSRYDLVLMDCHMPELDGYAATRLLRQRERLAGLPRIPVVALTANAMDGEREKCIEAGMDDHLAKPFMLEDMAQILARWLSQDSADAAPGPVWDARLALERLGGDRELLAEMKPMFASEAPKHLQGLASVALPRPDAAAIAAAAHALKGMAMHFCAGQVIDLAGQVERLARAGGVAQGDPLVAQLAGAVARLVAALGEDAGD